MASRAAGFRLRATGLGVLVWVAGLFAVPVTGEQDVGGGLYTTDQANRGAAIYEAQCASCHGGLRDFAPGMAALLGDHTFRASWEGRSLGELFGRIQETMPQDDPGTLSTVETAEIVAYILSGNRFTPGDTDLPDDLGALEAMAFEPRE